MATHDVIWEKYRNHQEYDMDVTELDNMTEAEIISAAAAAIRESRTGKGKEFDRLCRLAVANYPNITDAQKMLIKALAEQTIAG